VQSITAGGGSVRIRSLLIIIFTGLLTVACAQRTVTQEQEKITLESIADFETTASNVFFYYADVEAAADFYRQILGLRLTADYGFAKIMEVGPKSFITLVDASKGLHAADEPKTTAIALITDQLDEWWDYIRTQDVELKSDEFNAVAGRAHHGFVVLDPEGYLLEFERFNDHEENRLLMPILDETATLYVDTDKSNVPPGLGFKATIVWFYYKDMPQIQRFYEDVIGFDLVVDQGFVKIYRIGPSGYFGLVDEARGFHKFTEKKGVTLSFITAKIDDWYEYLTTQTSVQLRSKKVEAAKNHRAFVAYDPGGYYLEWNAYNEIPINAELLKVIEER
jgi:catechol 2,3-dioxygenase-like lactoylglutathione lyase family enzyme